MPPCRFHFSGFSHNTHQWRESCGDCANSKGSRTLIKAFVSPVAIRVATDKHKKQQSQGHTSGNELVS